MREDTKSRIESEDEVKSYIQNLKYALDNGARITFQAKRMVDLERDSFAKYIMAPMMYILRSEWNFWVCMGVRQHLLCRFILRKEHSRQTCFHTKRSKEVHL